MRWGGHGTGLSKKNEAGWDGTGQERTGHGTTFLSSRGALKETALSSLLIFQHLYEIKI